MFQTAPIGVDELDVQTRAEEGEGDVGFIERFAFLGAGLNVELIDTDRRRLEQE